MPLPSSALSRIRDPAGAAYAVDEADASSTRTGVLPAFDLSHRIVKNVATQFCDSIANLNGTGTAMQLELQATPAAD